MSGLDDVKDCKLYCAPAYTWLIKWTTSMFFNKLLVAANRSETALGFIHVLSFLEDLKYILFKSNIDCKTTGYLETKKMMN